MHVLRSACCRNRNKIFPPAPSPRHSNPRRVLANNERFRERNLSDFSNGNKRTRSVYKGPCELSTVRFRQMFKKRNSARTVGNGAQQLAAVFSAVSSPRCADKTIVNNWRRTFRTLPARLIRTPTNRNGIFGNGEIGRQNRMVAPLFFLLYSPQFPCRTRCVRKRWRCSVLNHSSFPHFISNFAVSRGALAYVRENGAWGCSSRREIRRNSAKRFGVKKLKNRS